MKRASSSSEKPASSHPASSYHELLNDYIHRFCPTLESSPSFTRQSSALSRRATSSPQIVAKSSHALRPYNERLAEVRARSAASRESEITRYEK